MSVIREVQQSFPTSWYPPPPPPPHAPTPLQPHTYTGGVGAAYWEPHQQAGCLHLPRPRYPVLCTLAAWNGYSTFHRRALAQIIAVVRHQHTTAAAWNSYLHCCCNE